MTAMGQKGEELTLSRTSLVCPGKRTLAHALLMSQKCHFRTHAVQQIGRLFDHLVGTAA